MEDKAKTTWRTKMKKLKPDEKFDRRQVNFSCFKACPRKSCIHKIRFSIKKAEGSFDSVTLF